MKAIRALVFRFANRLNSRKRLAKHPVTLEWLVGFELHTTGMMFLFLAVITTTLARSTPNPSAVADVLFESNVLFAGVVVVIIIVFIVVVVFMPRECSLYLQPQREKRLWYKNRTLERTCSRDDA